MRPWLSFARLGGIALALSLFASAASTAAGAATIYRVEPANVFVARGLQVDEEGETPPGAAAFNDDFQRRKRAREAAVATILGHNPFCDDCPPPSAEVVAEGGAPAPLVASTSAPAVQVLATMEALDPSRSLATIYDPVRGTWAAAIGDTLAPGVLVTAIGPGQLTYSRGSATGVLQVGQAPPPPPSPRTPSAEKPATEPKADPLADRVNCQEGQRCTIERSLIQDVMSNPAQLGGIRAFPSDGGFKIAGVRSGTLLHQLGLRNGDILTGVGGKPLESIDDALSLLPLLRSASNVEVTLSRKGKPITHEIEIV